MTIDADFSYLLQRYAARSGLRAIQVKGYAELSQVARETDPAVIFLEVDLVSNQNLASALRNLKEDSFTQDTPVVLISWVSEQETTAVEGVDFYLRKPVMYADFLGALASTGVSFRIQNVDLLDKKEVS